MVLLLLMVFRLLGNRGQCQVRLLVWIKKLLHMVMITELGVLFF
nr:MAG TPA: hypothetical protein [Bacteriophage sp.]